MFRATLSGLHISISKTASGGGRKRAPWVIQLHEDLFNTFWRLQSCGVKFNLNQPLIFGHNLEVESTCGPYGPTMLDSKSDKLVTDHINAT